MFDFNIPGFIVPDILLLIFPFIVIGSRLFCSAQSKVPWRIANIGFIAIFVLLNLIPGTDSAAYFIASSAVIK